MASVAENMEDRERIVAAGQELAQKRGYGGFILSDVADLSGIEAAQLNAQFQSKDELVGEIMQHYHAAFFGALATGSAEDSDPQHGLERFIGIVRDVLVVDNRMCLCGMLAADRELLSEAVRQQVAEFMTTSIKWLENKWRALGHADPHRAAVSTLARLEGGMLLCRATKDVGHFDAIADEIRDEARVAGN